MNTGARSIAAGTSPTFSTSSCRIWTIRGEPSDSTVTWNSWNAEPCWLTADTAIVVTPSATGVSISSDPDSPVLTMPGSPLTAP